MIDKFQARKSQPDGPPSTLARRATDRDLRGMNINEDDSEQAWAEFDEAMNQPVVPDMTPTEPGELH